MLAKSHSRALHLIVSIVSRDPNGLKADDGQLGKGPKFLKIGARILYRNAGIATYEQAQVTEALRAIDGSKSRIAGPEYTEECSTATDTLKANLMRAAYWMSQKDWMGVNTPDTIGEVFVDQ